jgi:hypothetical protein
LPEAEILVSIEKKISKFSAPPWLSEAENLLGLRKKNFQKFPHHHTCLRRKFWLALTKKNSKISAPQHLPEAENLLGLEEKKFQKFLHHHSCLRQKFCLALKKKIFKIFRTTTLG